MIIKDFKGKGKVTIRISSLTDDQKSALLKDEWIEDVEVQLEIKELKIKDTTKK